MTENADSPRRDFLSVLAVAAGGIGAASFVWPVIDSLNPAADVLALSTTEIDVSALPAGAALTVKWRGRPVFVRHRTAEEIAMARQDDTATLRDPQKDEDRAPNPEWLIVVGICTHLGCVPLGQKEGQPKGDFGGWFCPCHGSHYDISGRVRKGPAPKNLEIPNYRFLSDALVRIG